MDARLRRTARADYDSGLADARGVKLGSPPADLSCVDKNDRCPDKSSAADVEDGCPPK